jgi:hypothetical protein
MLRSRIGSISVSRIVVTGFFALTSARAQVTASFSVQPLETWKAAIGKRLPGTAVYDATVCNAGQATVVIPAGRVFTAARTKISTVSPLLVANTLSRSQDKTVAARTLEILGFFVWGIGVATISDSLKIPDNAKIALPLIGEALAHVGTRCPRQSAKHRPQRIPRGAASARAKRVRIEAHAGRVPQRRGAFRRRYSIDNKLGEVQ